MTRKISHLWLFAAITVLLSLAAFPRFTIFAGVPTHILKPHIIVVIADDLGRNDVGFHGSSQIPTPHLDALAYNGIVMNRFYSQCTCTPSRAAFMTGNYPIRSGMQGYPLKAGEDRGLPEDMATMPERMKKLGYETHLVGKWHLGAARRSDTPIWRGFDSHFGYWNGFVGYFDYLAFMYSANGTRIKGLDLHDQLEPVWSVQGQYATEVFTRKTLEIIDKHDIEVPLFLVLSHLAPHTGSDGVELGVPNGTLTNIKYSYIEDPRRRLYADVVNRLDSSLGSLIEKLSQKNMLDKSIVLFFSDNGAQTVGMYENAGSNWPLRGLKFSDFEGGVRTAAAVFSPLLERRGYVSDQLIHVADWLPTFYAAAGGDVGDLGRIDGINQWDVLSRKLPTRRSEILVNINEVDNSKAIITDRGRYKLLQGTYKDGRYDKYYGESGRGGETPGYNLEEITESTTNRIIERVTGVSLTNDAILKMRSQTDLSWCRNSSTIVDCREGCLFDLENDPCETSNIIEAEPKLAQELYQKLRNFTKEIVPQTNGPSEPASDPTFYNNTWCTWLDDEWCFKTPNSKNTTE